MAASKSTQNKQKEQAKQLQNIAKSQQQFKSDMKKMNNDFAKMFKRK